MADTTSTEATEIDNTEAPAETEDSSTEEQELENSDESFDNTDDDSEDSDFSEDDDDSESDDATEEEDEESGEGEEEQATTEDETPDDSTTVSELTQEEQQKAHNREMAARRLAEKEQRQALLDNEAAEYVAEGKTPEEQSRRQQEAVLYQNTVEINTNKLVSGYERAITDFPILRDSDPAVQAAVDHAINAFEAQSVGLDRLGNPVAVKGDIYSYLQNQAETIEKLRGSGARNQAKSKDREKSKVLTRPSRAPKRPKKDEGLDAFDEEADRW